MARGKTPTYHREGIPEGRLAIWSAIRFMKIFTLEELEVTTHQSYPNIRRYVRRLLAAGYLRLLQEAKGGGGTNRYRLIRLSGPLPPIPRAESKEVFDPNTQEAYEEADRTTGRDLGWKVMRRGEFQIADLLEAGMQKHNAYKYVQGLLAAGYLEITRPATTGPYAQPARYRLRRNTGVLAPVVSRGGKTYDPNLEENDDDPSNDRA